MRLFVAAEVPDDARRALARFRDEAADPDVWRPVRDESLHLTLAFLGNRPDADVDACGEVLRSRVRGAAPRLQLAGALLLPPRAARVLCAEVDDRSGGLAAVQSAVSDGLARASVYVPEKRAFRPHITVARLQRGARPPRVAEGLPRPQPLEFGLTCVTLFRSQLRAGGSLYEPLVRVRFDGG